MIKTSPTYVHGDGLTCRKYFSHAFMNRRLLYTSVWNWWKQTTLYSCLPLSVASLLIFAAILYQELGTGEETDWGLVVSVSLLPFLFIMPLIWAGTYYYSFIAARWLTRKLQAFISRHIPDATCITRLSPTNYTLLRKGIEYEVCYTHVPETDQSGRVRRNRPCFLVALYYAPQPGTELLWFDEDTEMRPSLIDEWAAYCEGKDSVRKLVLENYALFALFEKKELATPGCVVEAMEQLEYLLNRFSFFPLYLHTPLQDRIGSWLGRIDKPAPADIVALNIGIFETVTGYALYLTGVRHYDEADDDWACAEDFVPEQKYLDLSTERKDEKDWQQLRQDVTEAVARYTAQRTDDASSLFYHKMVTIGFDDGELTRIR